jgi:predicted ribosome quality control (RQC) complex YloA/Tae2 family protein
MDRLPEGQGAARTGTKHDAAARVSGALFWETWMAQDHVSDLKNARDELVRQRRASISVLADGDKYTEPQLDTLIRYQEAIEAIDRAIKEEQRAAKEQSAAELAASVQPLIKYED